MANISKISISQKREASAGQAVLLAVILFIVVSAITIGSFALPALKQVRIASQLLNSRESFFLAEAGFEDVIYRLNQGTPVSNQEQISLGGYSATISVEDIPQGKRVTAEGDWQSNFRKIQAELNTGGEGSAFFYGVHVGDGGLIMKNTSKVIGNVFSTGDVNLKNTSSVTDSVEVAGQGRKIYGTGTIAGDAFVDICEDVTVSGTLNANTNDNCTYGLFVSLGQPTEPVPLPITQEQIDLWKSEALAGGEMTGDYFLDEGSANLGPIKIDGNMTINGTAELIVGGTIWVTGDIDVANTAQVRLSGFYESASGIILSDGSITLQNSSISSGSGQSDSYLMYLSTASLNPAVVLKNSAQVDILYTSAGWVEIQNSAGLRTVTGYGIDIKNTAEVTFETGLISTLFTSGSSGGFVIENWREIE